MKSIRNWSLLVMIGFLLASTVGCTAVPPQEAKLKIVLLPVLDVIPVFIAEQNGYFAEQGIAVETVPVKSAQERDVLIQTAQVDAMLTDLMSNGYLNKNRVTVKAVYTARRPFPDAPMFRLLAGPNSAITDPADLRNVPIGIGQNTVIQYLTERMLVSEGLAPEEISEQEVSAIPLRYEQLMNGNIAAATLPDPLAQGAVAAGARVIVDDSKYPQYSQSVLSFRTEVLQTKPEVVRRFLVAWSRAVEELNAHPERYGDILIREGRVPDSIRGQYRMPPFPGAGVPSESEIADVSEWMLDKGMIERSLSYSEMVDDSYLPK